MLKLKKKILKSKLYMHVDILTKSILSISKYDKYVQFKLENKTGDLYRDFRTLGGIINCLTTTYSFGRPICHLLLQNRHV